MKTIRIVKSIAVLMLMFVTTFLSVTFDIQAQEKANGNITPQVYSRPVDNNARYLSQSTPGQMVPGKVYGVSVTMKNSGSKVWQKGSYSLKLMNVTESLERTWAVSNVDINSNVNPGEDVVFNFSLTAPMVEGDYNIQWQMAEGNAFFGEPSANVPVNVTGNTPVKTDSDMIENNAGFIHQNVPSEMDTKQTYDVIVIMKNNGTTTWKTGEFKLKVATKGGDNTVVAPWEVANVELSSDVYANSEVTFNFKVTAPENDGNYNFQCQMVKSGVYFGEPSTNVIVKVD
jgi:hypothetical protein